MAETESGNSSAQTHPPAGPEYLLALYATGTRAFPQWNLTGADLHGADLHDCNFFDADFTGSNLSGVDLSRANLAHARLINANLRAANLSDAFLDGADLTGADTTGMITDRPSSPPTPPPAAQAQPQAAAQPLSPSAINLRCASCGATIPAGSRFCPVCGSAQSQISAPYASASADSAHGIARVATSPSPSLYPGAPLASASDATQFGALIGDYPGSANPILYAVVAAICLLIALTGSAIIFEFDNGYRVIFAVAGITALVVAYLGRGAHAQLFERGFVITRAGKTTSARWEDIANVQLLVTRQYAYGFIPLAGKGHIITITLTNGERVRVLGSHFRNAEQLGQTVQRMWMKAASARRSGNATSS